MPTAQIQSAIESVIPQYDWASVGIAGVIVGTIIACAVYYFFRVHVPHQKAKQEQERSYLKAKQELELEREANLSGFVQQLSESHRSEVEYKQQTVALLTRMDQRQDGHADVCESTHKMVAEMHAQARRTA